MMQSIVQTARFAKSFGWIAAALLAAGPAHSAGAAILQQDDGAVLVLVSAPASYLGINIADIDEHSAHLLGLKTKTGVEVIAIDRDAPAGKAGLHLRDVILAVDGHAMNSAQQFREVMRAYLPLREVNFAVLRDGKPIKFTIKLADRAKLQRQVFEHQFNAPMPALGKTFGNIVAMQGGFPDASESEDEGNESVGGASSGWGSGSPGGWSSGWGMGAELDAIGPQLASFFGVKDGTGMLVKSVQPGSPAATAGLQAGDVVLKLNDENVLCPVDWVRGIQAGRGKPMQLTIVRNKRMETVTLPALQHTQALLGGQENPQQPV